LLIERDGIDPKMAEFAASAAQGHIGRAKYLATNENARKTREKIISIPSTVKDLASAFEAANVLLELAKEQAKYESEIRDEEELLKLKESYGSTGSKLATGGSKAVKELEKEQKTRNTRMVRDELDAALLNIAYVYRDIMLNQSGANELIVNNNIIDKVNQKSIDESKDSIMNTLSSILTARINLSKNSSSNLTLESLISSLRIK
jgi:DNA polymerase-3 subunit delta'